MLWALVPVKHLTQPKQRLKSVLEPPEREGLMLAMLRDVLTAIRGTSDLEGVMLVSRWPKASMLARELGTELFAESIDADLSIAVTEASHHLVEHHHADGTLIVPGDVPLVTAADLQALLVHHEHVTLVPDRDGEGTNAILCSPPNAIVYRFGPGSFKKHVESSYAAGVTPRVVRNAHLGQDIDEPGDLFRLLADLPPSHTREYLEDRNIAERLKARYPHDTLEFFP